MTLQGNLKIDYDNQSFDLNVKTILLKGVYYFFITDNEKGPSLLAGETIELVYTNVFKPGDQKATAGAKEIPEAIIDAIKRMLADNKQLWYY